LFGDAGGFVDEVVEAVLVEVRGVGEVAVAVREGLTSLEA